MKEIEGEIPLDSLPTQYTDEAYQVSTLLRQVLMTDISVSSLKIQEKKKKLLKLHVKNDEEIETVTRSPLIEATI